MRGEKIEKATSIMDQSASRAIVSRTIEKMRSVIVIGSIIALTACDAVTIPGEADDAPVTPVTPTTSTDVSSIVDTAIGAGTFDTLVTALQVAGLDTVLADENSTFTVFAPTDDAFTALGSDTLNDLLDDPDALRNVLLYHVIPDVAVDAQTAFSLAGGTVDAANGGVLAISSEGDDLFINDALVTAADIVATNGVIHVIDKVLVPGSVDTVVVTQTDGGSNDGGATAGNDGQGTSDSGNSGDQDNGQGNGQDDGQGNNSGEESHALNIVDTAVSAGGFSTLVAALQATGLDTVLADDKTQYTVFAPTDAAFAALGQDTINGLLADTETLSDILLYHVIGGSSVDAQTAISLAGQTVAAANGDEFALSLSNGNLFVNLSQVTVTDIVASNGIIHVIDTVLTPPAPVLAQGSIVDVAVTDGRFTTLVAALQATGLDAVLADHETVFTVFAPTDDAFAKLGQGTIDALLADLPTLSNILLTHVISGAAVDSVSAIASIGTAVETASGTVIHLSIRDGALFVNDSKVIVTDIRADNGIIHVIDTVIQ